MHTEAHPFPFRKVELPARPPWHTIEQDANDVIEHYPFRPGWTTLETHDELILTPETLAQVFPDTEYSQFVQLPTIPEFYVKKDLDLKLPMKHGAVAFVAPSTTGKDTLLQYIQPMYPSEFCFVQSTITRSRREEEKITSSYRHVTEQFMDWFVQQNMAIEVLKQGKYRYATGIQQMITSMGAPFELALWRGDVLGITPMQQYFTEQLPHRQFLKIGILAGMNWKDTKARIAKLRTSPGDEWRATKARMELELLDRCDILFINKPDPETRGKKSARLLASLFLQLIGRQGLPPENKNEPPLEHKNILPTEFLATSN